MISESKTYLLLVAAFIAVSLASCGGQPAASTKLTSEEAAPAAEFLLLSSGNPFKVNQALKTIEERWHPGSATMLIELNRYIGGASKQKILELVERKTGHGDAGRSEERKC